MAPGYTSADWLRLAAVFGALLLFGCRQSTPSPLSSEAPRRPTTLEATFVAAWGPVPESSLFSNPSGVAADAAGFVYVADTGRDRVLKFSPAGTLQAAWETAGDGTPLHRPSGLAIDRRGNLYVADTGNHRIVKFNPAGRALGLWGSLGGEDGHLNSPSAVAVDGSGNLYVADTKNHRVQRFGPGGRALQAWGAYGSAPGQFNAPSGIAVDGAGHVYVADTWNHRVQKFDASGRFLQEWGTLGRGGGRFNAPTGIAVDRAGQVYVISAGLQPAPSRNLADILRVQRVQVFSGTGRLRRDFGGAGSAPGQFDRALALALDRAGNVYVADTWNHRVQKFSPAGTPLRQWGSLPVEVLKRPAALTVDAAGHVYVADQGNFRVVRIDPQGMMRGAWRFAQTAVFEDVAVGADGSLYVALTESGVPLVRRLSAVGTMLREWRGFASVKGVAVDAKGSVFVADWRSQEIRRFDATGRPVTRWRVEFPGDLTPDSTGGVYTVERGRHRIVKFASSGTVLGTWSGPGNVDGSFQDGSLAVDAKGNVFLADPLHHQVQVFASDGAYLGRWGVWGVGPGQFYQPRGIAVDRARTIYVAEPLLNRVQIFRVKLPPD